MLRRSALFTPLLLLAACVHPADVPSAAREAYDGFMVRAGVVSANDPYGDNATKLVYLDQGWSPQETLWYYFADQGSVLLPYDVLLNLEQPASTTRLMDPEHTARFRFLAQQATPNNPDALPIGFSRHGDRVGFTCAACHTGQITYQGTAVRIDGAPALVDAIGFLNEIRASLKATLADEAKLTRFVHATRGDVPEPEASRNREDVVQELQETLAWFESYLNANQSTTVEGFGRLDAIGRILNQVVRFTSDPKNSLEPNAPTNFPVLWDAPRHDFVQWTAFSPNAGPFALGRNVGEVIGVFGELEVKPFKSAEEAKQGYASTVEAHALVSMEDSLHGLQSPVWPEHVLPPIDIALATRGAEVYGRTCVSCHALLNRADPRRLVTAMATAVDVVGTDPQAADNLVNARLPTGILEGSVGTTGKTYGPTEPALTFLVDIVTGLLSAQPVPVVRAVANGKRYGISETVKQGRYHPKTEAEPFADLRSYKARPLNGIWASAPYLHNGSVPTLYDLLLPADQRPTTFAVGRWEYDPRKVGYVSEGTVPWVYDTSVTGNHNIGHEFGAPLSDEDRWALVEFLKTL